MIKKCYIVEVSTELENLFNHLNDYGIDYYCDHLDDTSLIITLDCVEGELVFIENLFAPYV